MVKKVLPFCRSNLDAILKMASALGENINIGGVTFFAGEDVILELTLYVRLSISIAGWVTGKNQLVDMCKMQDAFCIILDVFGHIIDFLKADRVKKIIIPNRPHSQSYFEYCF